MTGQRILGVIIVLSVFLGCDNSSDNNPSPPIAENPDIQVVTVQAYSINDSSANSGGTISASGASPISEKGVCWSLQPNPNISMHYLKSL